jgi:uncharacterized protein (DUF2062 family)
VRKLLRRVLPAAGTLRNQRALRWIGPLLERSWLWQISCSTVAAGAAIGVFFAFATPIAQIPLAAAAAVMLRANLPAAVLGTFVSNPFTFVPIVVLAYEMGSACLGMSADRNLASEIVARISSAGFSLDYWLEHATDVSGPLALGLLVMAVVGAGFSWVGVQVAWRLGVLRARRRLLAARRLRSGGNRSR